MVVKYVEDSIKTNGIKEETENTSRNSLQTITLLEAIEEGKYDACIGRQEEMKRKQELKKEYFQLEMILVNGILKINVQFFDL